MTTSFHKTFFIFGLLAFLTTSSIYCQTKFKLFAENSLGNYKLLHFVKDQDSIVIITKNIVLTNKIENKIEEIVTGKIGKKISKLKTNGRTFWFYYKMKSQIGLINSGGFPPGKAKETIYTYRNFPIFIEKFP
jgi:hypothetical protein